MNVSIGQACANTLAGYLRQSFPEDVTVFDRWPEANVQLFAPTSPNAPKPRAAISCVRVGRRARSEVFGLAMGAQATLSPGQVQMPIFLGSIEQPIQLDIWTKSDDDRDDIVAQLDGLLNAGWPSTLGIYDDPVRDGILLALADTAYVGLFADYWFDEPELQDSPESIQRAEYRATYFGEARALLGQTEQVPLMTNLGYAQQLSTSATPPATQLWEIVTMTQNPAPPPLLKIVRTTGSTP